MIDYNFKIKILQFSCNGEFQLDVTVSGNNFPKPDSKEGSITDGLISFDLTSSNGNTVNEFTFSFNASDELDQYSFEFINYPDGSGDNMNGSVTTNFDDPCDLFNIDTCTFIAMADGEVEVELEAPTARMVNSKSDIRLRKRPQNNKSYKCIDTSLNSDLNAIVMTLVEAEEDDLTGNISDIPNSSMINGLTIKSCVVDANPEPNSMAGVSMVN